MHKKMYTIYFSYTLKIMFTVYMDIEDGAEVHESADVLRGGRLLPSTQSRGRSAHGHLPAACCRSDSLLRPAGRPQG